MRNPPQSLAPQAAKASWVSFIFAYGLAYFGRGPTGPKEPVFVLFAVVFLVIGFALGLIALLGMRKHGTRGVLIPAVIGVVLNGLIIGAGVHGFQVGRAKAKARQEMKAQVIATLADYFQKLRNGGPVEQVRSTGNAELDAVFRLVVDLNNEVLVVIAKVDAEVTQLDEQVVCSVLHDRAAMRSELGKRTAAQRAIQQARDEVAARVDSARQRLRGMPFDQSETKSMLRGLDLEGTARIKYDEFLSLALARQEAEAELFRFMFVEFGRYRLVNGEPRFTVPGKQEEYNRLSECVERAYQSLEDYERRRNELLQATPTQLRELLERAFGPKCGARPGGSARRSLPGT